MSAAAKKKPVRVKLSAYMIRQAVRINAAIRLLTKKNWSKREQRTLDAFQSLVQYAAELMEKRGHRCATWAVNP